jgi:hypothetical protein
MLVDIPVVGQSAPSESDTGAFGPRKAKPTSSKVPVEMTGWEVFVLRKKQHGGKRIGNGHSRRKYSF